MFYRRFGIDIIQWISIYNNSQNWYVILNRQNNKVRELNMYTNVKTKNRKEIQLQVVVDSECTHTGIDKQLVKEKRIKTKQMDRSFEVFNTNRTKNREVTQFALLKVEINKYKKQIDAVVIDLNGIDMFLRYDWQVKHNSELNWNSGTIQFTRCPKICRTQH